MRPSTHRLHARTLFVTLSLVAFSVSGTSAFAANLPTGSATSTDGAPTEPPPPPFIETTGHGLAPVGPTTYGDVTGTSTDSSSSLSSGTPTSSTSKSGTPSSRSTKPSPTEDYMSWLYRLLGIEW